MVCTPDLYYQEFKIEGLQLRKWKHAFLKRLDMFNKKIIAPAAPLFTEEKVKELFNSGLGYHTKTKGE